MVKLAVAGASGKLAREVIDKLVDSGKHEIIGMVRREPSSLPALPGVKWVQTTYQDKAELVEILSGVNTVFSFLVDSVTDPSAEMQKRIIDASIDAGVKRIAPSEFAIGQKLEGVIESMPWYTDKLAVRKHLQEVNKNGKVIEYTLFQPGGFTNYLAYPHQTAKHYRIGYPTFINVEEGTAFIVENTEDVEFPLNTIEDIAAAAAQAVEHEGEWPEVGGLKGETFTLGELISMAEKVRGKKFKVDKLKMEDLKAGDLKTDFYPRIPLPGLPQEQVEHFSKVVSIGMLVSLATGSWAVTDEWNSRLPDWKPTGVEDYMNKVWSGKP